MLPYLVLKHYKPERWNARVIGEHLSSFTRSLGLVPHEDPAHGPIHWKSWFSDHLHAEVRRRTSNKFSAEEWHQDGDTTPGSKMNHALVLWASNHPTEFKLEGKIFQPKPFEVVIVRNLLVHHRRPVHCPFRRWVYRQRVAVPGWKELP